MFSAASVWVPKIDGDLASVGFDQVPQIMNHGAAGPTMGEAVLPGFHTIFKGVGGTTGKEIGTDDGIRDLVVDDGDTRSR